MIFDQVPDRLSCSRRGGSGVVRLATCAVCRPPSTGRPPLIGLA